MKVKITLPDGKTIELEGTPDELKQLDIDLGKAAPVPFNPLTPIGPNPFPYIPSVPAPLYPWAPNDLPTVPNVGRVCMGPCNPECYACNGRPWLGIYPPPCICNGYTVTHPVSPPGRWTLTTNQTLPYNTSGYIAPVEPNDDE